MKKTIKSLSIFLAIIFCIQVVPALSYKIFAADMGIIKPSFDEESDNTEITALCEDESKRTENEKTIVFQHAHARGCCHADDIMQQSGSQDGRQP